MKKDEREQMIKEWFEKHEAKKTSYPAEDGKGEIEIIRWKRPGTTNYSVIYMTYGNMLFVCGDLGAATYCASTGFAFWSSCDISYFAGKCEASEFGRGYPSWDPDEAKRLALEYFAERAKEAIDKHDRETIQRRRKRFIEAGGPEAIYNRQEWTLWLQQHGCDAFGQDFYEFAYFGDVIDTRCEAHLIGLKMAVAQLNKPTQP